MALTVALAQIRRGDEVPPNTTAALVFALERICRGENGDEDAWRHRQFVTPLRFLCEISMDGWGYTYEDEVPPAQLYRVVRYESYECECCTGGENVVISEHPTRPAADVVACQHPGAWVEAWDTCIDGPELESHWRRLPTLMRHVGLTPRKLEGDV
jgi:hypothetical protein